MEYIQGLPTQTGLFFLSLGFGFLLGILYDIFRMIRMIISGSEKFVFAADMLYFLLCGVLSFFFILVTDDGRLRFYTVIGEALGWMIYYFSFGTVAMKLTVSVVRISKRVFSVVFKPIKFIFGKIMSFIKKIAKFFKKSIRKTDKKSKFNLQKQKSLVYNLYSYFYNYKIFKNKGK